MSELEEIRTLIEASEISINHAKKKLEALEKQAATPAPEARVERWKPYLSKDYYAIDTFGVPTCLLWDDDFSDAKTWESFNCFQTKEEAQQEALRTRARRKLEWLARELNEGKQQSQPYTYFINTINEVSGYAELFHPPMGCTIFYEKADAEYALSQMTSEELEVLR